MSDCVSMNSSNSVVNEIQRHINSVIIIIQVEANLQNLDRDLLAYTFIIQSACLQQRLFSALQISMATTVSVSGSNVQIVYVGGYRQGNGPISDGFVGCVKVSEKGDH